MEVSKLADHFLCALYFLMRTPPEGSNSWPFPTSGESLCWLLWGFSGQHRPAPWDQLPHCYCATHRASLTGYGHYALSILGLCSFVNSLTLSSPPTLMAARNPGFKLFIPSCGIALTVIRESWSRSRLSCHSMVPPRMNLSKDRSITCIYPTPGDQMQYLCHSVSVSLCFLRAADHLSENEALGLFWSTLDC